MMNNLPIARVAFKDLDADTFRRQYFLPGKPVVLEGAANSWPAMNKWDLTYLNERVGDRRVTMDYSGDGYLTYTAEESQNARREEKSFSEAAAEINDKQATDRVCYVRNISVPDVLPELLPDFAVPEGFVDPELVTKTQFWYGTAGCVTALHFDWPSNFLAQVSGRKRCLLFSPDDTPNVYPASDQPPEKDGWIDLREHSLVNPDAPDLEKYPNFAQAQPHEAVLGPGDVLWLPPCWWHQVRSLDSSISVNFWWPPRAEQLAFWEGGDAKIIAAFDAGILAAFLAGGFESRIDDGVIGMGEACLESGKPWAGVLIGASGLEAILAAAGKCERVFVAESGPWDVLTAAVEGIADAPISEEMVGGWQILITEARKGEGGVLDPKAVNAMLGQMRQFSSWI